MHNMTRKEFMAAAAATAVAATAGIAHAEEAAPAMAPVAPIELERTPGSMPMKLADLNAMRQAHIDACTDYVKADGTVVPAVYVKLRALTEGYGFGVGPTVSDTSFDFFMAYWTPEEAQAMLEMPMGVAFTAGEFAQKSGRDEADCEALCYDLSVRGLLMRWTRAGVHYYHHVAYAHGLWEYGLLAEERKDANAEHFHALDTLQEWVELHKTEDLVNAHVRADLHSTVLTDARAYACETPFYFPIPVDKEVVADPAILPLDDWRKIIERHEVISVATCQCRLRRVLQDDVIDGCDHPMETCMAFGEEAEYYIENGCGRQISKEEAIAILERNVELGMVIQSAYSKASEVICSCHGDCCDILSGYVALGDAAPAVYANTWEQISHYNLVVDHEACIKCGTCVPRCPVLAISMGEDQIEVAGNCIRCGQCGLVCPVGARKLYQKETFPEMPQDMLEDYNLKAAVRYIDGQVLI